MRTVFFSSGPNGLSTSIGLLCLRCAAGGLMLLLHGWGKLQAFGERAAKFPDPLGVTPELSMGLTIFAEVFCAALILVGLCTRWAAGVGLFTMIVAAFVIHGDDPLKKQELALMYLSMYGALALIGPGRLSLDYMLCREE